MVHFFLGAPRPYDIFHQINMLWQVYSPLNIFQFLFSTKPANSVFWEMLMFYRPGLLGMTKYEFAKTYCDLKYFKGVQGKYFAVILLEELLVSSLCVCVMYYVFIWLIVMSIEHYLWHDLY